MDSPDSIIPPRALLNARGFHSLLFQESVARYNFALHYVRKECLDIGCGYGLGSFLLAFKADTVTGTDLDAAAIKTASEHFRKDNLFFEQKDVHVVAGEEKDYDSIVCFEVLEHLDNPGDTVAALSRLLKPKGVMLISLPINDNVNTYHKHQFTSAQQIISFCTAFKHTKVFYQLGCNIHELSQEPEDIFYNLIVVLSHDDVLQKRYGSLSDLLGKFTGTTGI